MVKIVRIDLSSKQSKMLEMQTPPVFLYDFDFPNDEIANRQNEEEFFSADLQLETLTQEQKRLTGQNVWFNYFDFKNDKSPYRQNEELFSADLQLETFT